MAKAVSNANSAKLKFIADPNQAALQIAINNRWWTYPLGGVFALGGLGFWATLYRQTLYRFDRTFGQLIIERHNLGRVRRNTYSLSSLQALVLEESTTGDGDPVTHVAIFLRDGTRLGRKAYDNYYSRAERAAVIQQVNTFVGPLPPSP